ncbi:putative transcriptional regulators [Comamonas testosteroni TK102]|uniref:Putative transcriptional regulators n=1 Tax=Comamonas testosteroni TK102 TaxID=1392005 RepID=A0A076PP02_COMTE|nr:putative transcriptional regulators [Comamonas testosteroni TK102]
MYGELDFLAIAGKRLVGRVVDHLLQDVQGVVGARIHAGTLFDRLKTLENADRAFGIFVGRFDCHGGGL